MLNDIRIYLGELVIAFANLEDSLCEGLAEILNIEYSDSKIIFSSISFNKKTQIINALLRKYYKDNNDDYIYELLSKANNLEQKRNTFIHSDWELFIKPKKNGKSGVVFKRMKLKYKRKSSPELSKEEINTQELKNIKEVIDELYQCAYELQVNLLDIGYVIHSH